MQELLLYNYYLHYARKNDKEFIRMIGFIREILKQYKRSKYLIDEIIYEILKFLDAKSLLISAQVSKIWCKLSGLNCGNV